MLRSRFTTFLNDCPAILTAYSSGFHTSNIYGKCKKERTSCKPPAVAIILCGCGHLDGSDISESISAAIHVSQKEMVPRFFAPDADICTIVDHYTKEVDCNAPPRNALVEAARIARSAIKPLCECEVCKHDALIIPGGFGVARTLSNFAEKGADCSVIPDLKKLIEEFYCGKKPIGSICIASAIVAKVLKGVKVTLGKDCPKEDWPHAEAIAKVKDMGAKVELKGVKHVTRCKKYNVFSTPAWMYKRATYGEVHSSIGKLVNMMKKNMQ